VEDVFGSWHCEQFRFDIPVDAVTPPPLHPVSHTAAMSATEKAPITRIFMAPPFPARRVEIILDEIDRGLHDRLFVTFVMFPLNAYGT